MSHRNSIERARVLAAETAAIASIPKSLLDAMNAAQKRHVAAGGCKGCGSMIYAAHHGHCTLPADLY